MIIDRSKARHLCKYLLDNLSWDIIWLYQLWCSSLGRMIWFCSASSNDLAADHLLPPPPWLLNPQRPRENLRQRGIWQISPADRAWEQRRRKRAANWLDAGNQKENYFAHILHTLAPICHWCAILCCAGSSTRHLICFLSQATGLQPQGTSQ